MDRGKLGNLRRARCGHAEGEEQDVSSRPRSNAHRLRRIAGLRVWTMRRVSSCPTLRTPNHRKALGYATGCRRGGFRTGRQNADGCRQSRLRSCWAVSSMRAVSRCSVSSIQAVSRCSVSSMRAVSRCSRSSHARLKGCFDSANVVSKRGGFTGPGVHAATRLNRSIVERPSLDRDSLDLSISVQSRWPTRGVASTAPMSIRTPRIA